MYLLIIVFVVVFEVYAQFWFRNNLNIEQSLRGFYIGHFKSKSKLVIQIQYSPFFKHVFQRAKTHFKYSLSNLQSLKIQKMLNCFSKNRSDLYFNSYY